MFYYHRRINPPTISRRLSEEGITASRVGIYKFLRKYTISASIARRQGSGRRSKLTDDVKKLVDEKMHEDDE